MFQRIRRLFHQKMIAEYIEAGGRFGLAMSDVFMLGEETAFEDLLSAWEMHEKEYARRGYRTIPLDEFVDLGGFRIALKTLGQFRDKHEEPVFHAQAHRIMRSKKPGGKWHALCDLDQDFLKRIKEGTHAPTKS